MSQNAFELISTGKKVTLSEVLLTNFQAFGNLIKESPMQSYKSKVLSTFTDQIWSIKETVLAVTVTLVRPWINEQIQIAEHSNTCNDFKPARQGARTLCVLLACAYSARPISQAKNPRRPNFPAMEKPTWTNKLAWQNWELPPNILPPCQHLHVFSCSHVRPICIPRGKTGKDKVL